MPFTICVSLGATMISGGTSSPSSPYTSRYVKAELSSCPNCVLVALALQNKEYLLVTLLPIKVAIFLPTSMYFYRKIVIKLFPNL